ncbi:hypothetical protein [Actinomadura livida]|uniref:Uncharacterized protein n=1 Tax=Actinomadura livida TaxID=79909 RepID=A0A7W7I6V9_9ACTN|nr:MULTISPECIES: hypothetical protein [Actinomadura]MBB4771640.1 hypothetical protein [Actinomadura catellatispora]GGU01533.1 hypothetical protein GCM10010208_26630 [Actinomadura livida]
MQQRHGRQADPREARVRERLEAIRTRSAKSSSWRTSTQYLYRLMNRNGFVPVKARLSREDLSFLAGAREEVIMFAELGVRLLDLHRPQESGGISSDPGAPIHRCRACMARWPCPTFRAIDETLSD